MIPACDYIYQYTNVYTSTIHTCTPCSGTFPSSVSPTITILFPEQHHFPASRFLPSRVAMRDLPNTARQIHLIAKTNTQLRCASLLLACVPKAVTIVCWHSRLRRVTRQHLVSPAGCFIFLLIQTGPHASTWAVCKAIINMVDCWDGMLWRRERHSLQVAKPASRIIQCSITRAHL